MHLGLGVAKGCERVLVAAGIEEFPALVGERLGRELRLGGRLGWLGGGRRGQGSSKCLMGSLPWTSMVTTRSLSFAGGAPT
ncbi:hypothetical protein BE20_02425 [Sorangium cellulosum]|nr:hypothetical protein BE20_02425 [Sorangium cellulosum]